MSRLREDVRIRTLQAARYILESGATVRDCARQFGVSKTTIHKDMRLRLGELDENLYGQVDEILNQNLRERHLRGGEATRQKFKRLQEG